MDSEINDVNGNVNCVGANSKISTEHCVASDSKISNVNASPPIQKLVVKATSLPIHK
jgi:hypothetical protein